MLKGERAISEIVKIHQVFAKTHRAFMHFMVQDETLGRDEVNYLATVTLSHIDDIQTGYKWAMRTEYVPKSELPYILDPSDIIAISKDPDTPSKQILPPDLQKIMAFQHAQVVFAYMPKLPKSIISFPGNKSYVDIKIPRTPLEFRERVNELANAIWSAAVNTPASSWEPEKARRVYGFFETGMWLTRWHLQKMGYYN